MKTIKHASEIYPNASPWFWAGVHVYLSDGEQPCRPCENDFILGYNQAMISNLKDKYTYKPL